MKVLSSMDNSLQSGYGTGNSEFTIHFLWFGLKKSVPCIYKKFTF